MPFNQEYINAFLTKASFILDDCNELIPSKLMSLGKYENNNISNDSLIKIMNIWVNSVDKLIALIKESGIPKADNRIAQVYKERGFTYDEFYYLTDNKYEVDKYGETPAYIFTETISKDMRNRKFGRMKYTLEDYIKLILSFNLVPTRFLTQKRDALISVDAFKSHTYSVARTRVGKTELMKLIIYNLIKTKDDKTSLLVLDPHGQMIKELRRLKINQELIDQVVYIDPCISSNHSPVFNPFQIKNKDQRSVAYATDTILDSFMQLLKDQELSGNMRRLMRHVITALLYIENTTMLDMLIILSAISRNKKNKVPHFSNSEIRLIESAKSIPEPLTKNFFKHGWKEVDSRTLTACIERVDSILSHPLVRNFVVGKSSLDFEYYMNNGKIILVNLDVTQLGSVGSEMIGRLITSEAQNISARRSLIPKRDRAKSIIFLDEAQLFMSPAIEKALSEFSKFGSYLFLTHQHKGQIENSFMEGIMSNTDVKIIGKNSEGTMTAVSKNILVPLDDLLKVRKYHFYAKIGDNPAFLFKSSDQLLDKKDSAYYISENEAKISFDPVMIKKYYRKVKDRNEIYLQLNDENDQQQKNDMVAPGVTVALNASDF